MSAEEISGEVFEYKSYPKNFFYLLNVFALLKVATEAMIQVSRISVGEAYNMIAHPFRDGAGSISGIIGLSYPFLLLVSLVFIFAFEKFEFGIFSGFCICFFLDNIMSRKLIRKAAIHLPLDAEVLNLSIQPEVVRSQVFKNNLFTAWRVILLHKNKIKKDCYPLDDAKSTIFHESESLQLTYNKALALSKAYNLPIDFQNSEGASQNSLSRAVTSKNIKI